MEQERNREEYKEDGTLARKLRAGNSGAWSQFYGLYAAPVFRFVLSRMGGHEEVAADVAHDVIVVAMERIATYKPRKGSLWAWLCGIAVNKIRESSRAQRRDDRLQECDIGRPAAETCQSGLEFADALAALAPLNPRHQEVLRLKYVEDFSVREIAEQLGVNEKAIESRLTRAREAFRSAHEERKGVADGGTGK